MISKSNNKLELQKTYEEKALNDFSSYVGKTVLVRIISGYVGSDSIDIVCDPPVKARIINTSKEDILHWNEDWLDPYWDVELIQPHSLLNEAESLWINPIRCYNINGDIETTSEWVLDMSN